MAPTPDDSQGTPLETESRPRDSYLLRVAKLRHLNQLKAELRRELEKEEALSIADGADPMQMPWETPEEFERRSAAILRERTPGEEDIIQ